jgi:filamentous hemagglutinin family protein
MTFVLLLIVSGGVPAFGTAPITLPAGERIVFGSGQILREGATLTIVQESNAMIIEWEHFDIDAGARVVFRQPTDSIGAVNRIRQPEVSRISGDLFADGKVGIMNSSGINLEKTSRLKAKHVMVSTLHTPDADFFSGSMDFHPEIKNIPNETGGCITQSGSIEADGGTVELRTQSGGEIENSGIIRARTTESGSGRILLIADRSTGRVVVGGTLDASAPGGGSGGFIETSAADVQIHPDAVITTRGKNGKSGQWLLDPTDFIIAPENGDLTGDQLSRYLQDSDIEIQSTSGTTEGKGDIYVNDHITWSANTLTLSAYRNIFINREIFGSQTAALTLRYGQGSSNGIVDGKSADYMVNAPVNLPKGLNFQTQQGFNGYPRNFTIITELGEPGSTTTQDLQGISGNLKGSRGYALGCDIDASSTRFWNNGSGFSPITKIDDDGSRWLFSGILDGLGHKVSDLYICNQDRDCVGLIYTNCGTIRNLTLKNMQVDTQDRNFVGALAGKNFGIILNCSSTGSIAGNAFVGGLVGENSGYISTCYSTASVSGISNVGGVAGIQSNPTGVDSYLMNSYAGGIVTGQDFVGGLVGCNGPAVDGRNLWIKNCYSSARVNGTKSAGGINCGPGRTSTINSFWDTEAGGLRVSGSGTGKTTEEMKRLETFLEAGWDIDNQPHTQSIWRIYDGFTYPLLRNFMTPITLELSGSKPYDKTAEIFPETLELTCSSADIWFPERVMVGEISTTSPNAGSYPLEPDFVYSHQEGYDIEFSAPSTYIITPAPLTVTAKDVAKKFDGTPFQGGDGVTCKGFISGESINDLEGTVNYGGDSQGAVDPGTYCIIPSGLFSNNYDISFVSGTLQIYPSVGKYQITVSADPVEGGTVTGDCVFDQPTFVTVIASPNPGWRFIQWTENGKQVSSASSYSFTAKSGRTLTAHFKSLLPVKN